MEWEKEMVNHIYTSNIVWNIISRAHTITNEEKKSEKWNALVLRERQMNELRDQQQQQKSIKNKDSSLNNLIYNLQFYCTQRKQTYM